GPEDVDRAVSAAKEAYASWRLVPAPKRGEIVFRFAALVAEHKQELAELMTREMGKVLAEAGGDVQEAIDMSYYMAGEGRRLSGQTTPSELPDKFNMSVRQPIGVVGVITPWNFPIAIPSWKIVPALVCGNTVVFKPANDTPALGERFVELLAEAGVPAGVVTVVPGSGREPIGRGGRGDAARPGLGGRHGRGAGDQRQGAREDPLVHGDRQGRGRRAADRRRGRDRQRPRPRLLLPADDLRRRRAADADR